MQFYILKLHFHTAAFVFYIFYFALSVVEDPARSNHICLYAVACMCTLMSVYCTLVASSAAGSLWLYW